MSYHRIDQNDVQVWLLGAFHLKVDGKLVTLPTHKSASLLAYLILHPGPHSREKLCTLFWGDSSEEKAHTSLRKALTFLRQALPEDLVLADRDSVQLHPNFPIWVDVFVFEQAARQFIANPTIKPGLFDINLYTGDLLEDFYDDWIFPLREQMLQVYTRVLLRSAETARMHSEYQVAMDYARLVLQHDPANERAFQHLMICHVLTNDRVGALAQYWACQRALEKELGVEPSRETRALFDWIQQSAYPSLAARLTNLPIPISGLVGRERELLNLKQALGHARLISLTGPGGSGKTRLAIQAATDLIDCYDDGVWWVELSPLANDSLVPAAVAKALGVNIQAGETTQDALANFLGSRRVLLVLDNCEHLLDACARLVEGLLLVCPGLQVLATSRESLGLTGEVIWHVPPLLLPDPAHVTFADLLMQYDGIHLFVQRARAARYGFTLTDQNAQAVMQICQSLDGLPLAIELAAARVKTLSVDQIAERLNDRFRLLAVENRSMQIRHRTLRATEDWSYELLSNSERTLFQRLSAFHGGWTLEAAEKVCSGNDLPSPEILDLLSHLVDKSLVNFHENQRYDMLETIREYAAEKLAESGDQAWINGQCLDYFLGLALTGDEKVRSFDQLAWIQRLDAERNNFDSVLEKALRDPEQLKKGCELVTALVWYWGMIGDYLHAHKWTQLYLTESTALAESQARARLLYNAGALSIWGMKWLDAAEALSLVDQSLQIWHRLGIEFEMEKGQCLLAKGWIEAYFWGLSSGQDLVQQAIDIFKETDHIWWQAWAMNLWIGIQQRNHADRQSILENLDELLLLWPKTGDCFSAAVNTLDKSVLMMESGKLAEAWRMMEDCLRTFRQFNAVGYIYQVLENLGDCSRMMHQHDQAQDYYEQCISLAAPLGWNHKLHQLHAGLGFVALHRGDDQLSEIHFTRVLVLGQKYAQEDSKALAIGGHAALRTIQNELPLAARMWGAYDTAAAQGTLMKLVDRQEMDQYRSRCVKLLGAEEFEREYQMGRSLLSDEILLGNMRESQP